MIAIRLVNLFIAVAQGMEKPCCFKPVQFESDCICGFPEFRLQPTEVSLGAAVKEKLPEELYPCFRSDKGINHHGQAN
jgi:hypothetical protein